MPTATKSLTKLVQYIFNNDNKLVIYKAKEESSQDGCYPRAWLLQNGFPDLTKKLRPSRFFLHSLATSVGVTFTKDLSTLDIKTFPLHVFFAERAIKTL